VFQVSGLLEQALIAELAAAIWKQLRLRRLEKHHLLTQLERRPSSAELREVSLNPCGSADLFLNDPQMANHLKAVIEGQFQANLEAFTLAPNAVKATSMIRGLDILLFEWLLAYAEQSGRLVKTEKMRNLIANEFFAAQNNPVVRDLRLWAWSRMTTIIPSPKPCTARNFPSASKPFARSGRMITTMSIKRPWRCD
jgi:hypothetical protein